MFSISDMSGTPVWRFADAFNDFARALENVENPFLISLEPNLSMKSASVNKGGEVIGSVMIGFSPKNVNRKGFLLVSITSKAKYRQIAVSDAKEELDKQMDIHIPYWKTVVDVFAHLYEAQPWCAYAQRQNDGTYLYSFEWSAEGVREEYTEQILKSQANNELCLFTILP